MEDDFFEATHADLFLGLNPEQSRAVSLTEGPLMILAGPGSGKTRVIAHRIAYMVQQGIPAGSILALTFTNKAAKELADRIGRLVPGQYVWTGTFHRFCSRLLRKYGSFVGLSENFSILDMDDAKKVFNLAIEEADTDPYVSNAAVQSEISKAKNALITAAEYQARPESPVGRVVEKVYPIYQRRLLECNSVDFDDLLFWVALLLQENAELRSMLDQRYAYIMVDEYQDTNLAQYAIVRSLSNDCPNLAVTGDPDQSIYGWRGADIRNILGFERDFPSTQVVRLEQNYRSTESILKVADRLIVNNRQRKPKRLVPTRMGGQRPRVKVAPTPQDEAEWIAREIRLMLDEGIWEPQDIAIFYRANWLSRNLEHEFTSLAIPYQLVNGFEFYQRKEIKDLIAYLRLIANPKNDVALERVINEPARKIGKVTLLRIRQLARKSGCSMLEACRLSLDDSSILGRASGAVRGFIDQIDALLKHPWDKVHPLLKEVIRVTQYAKVLENDKSEMSAERLGNVEELLVAVDEFDQQHGANGGLEAYLENAALVSDTDKLDSDTNRVRMMTLHAAKGLEFPCVFIVGVEQGVLPHERSMADSRQLEEERRLFFVGITRAMQDLTITRAESRMMRGAMTMSPPSCFLVEIQSPDVEILPSAPKYTPREGYDGNGFLIDTRGAGRDRRAPVEPPRDWVADECGGTSFDVGSKAAADTDFDFGSDDDDSFDSATIDEGEASEYSTASNRTERPTTPTGLPKMMTAADLLPQDGPESQPLDSGSRAKPSAPRMRSSQSNSDGRSAPDQLSDDAEYRLGEWVEHPQYGDGKVLALAGSNAKRMVTVHFEGHGVKKFRIKFCGLKRKGGDPSRG